MSVDTDEGGWLVPPLEGVWIPGGVEHSIRMLSDVATRSVYFDSETARRFSGRCQVVGVSPLLRQLLIEAADLPIDYEPKGRGGLIMALIVEELLRAPALPLCVPIPRQPALAEQCRRFAESPSIRDTIDGWSADLGLSRRTFTRLFRRETGLSFSAWQRRACLQAALPRLLEGEPVTRVAFDLGYSNSSAFTAMFGALVGIPPDEYRRRLR